MLLKKVLNGKFLKVLFAGVISYYIGLLVLQSHFKAGVFLGVAMFVFIFLTKVEYAFYFLLATRGIIDIFYSVEATGSLRMTHLIGVGIIAIFLYYAIVVSRYNVFKLGVNRIYFIFLITSIPAILLSERLVTGFGYWFRLFQGFAVINLTIMIILAAGNDSYKKRIYVICCAIILALCVPYLIFLKNFIQGETVRGSGGIMRVAAYGGYNNAFSYLLFAVFTFCLFLYSVSARGFQKKAWFIILGIITYTIYYTYTRNIWMSLAVILFAWALLRKKFLINIITATIVIAMIIFNPAVQDRLMDAYLIFSSKGGFFDLAPELLAGRISNWQSNVDYFINHSTFMEKLIGNGFDVKSEISATYMRTREQGEHNNYLTLLMTTGICGLSAYLLYLFKLFQESFRLLRRTRNVYLKSLAQVFISLLFSYVILSNFTHILWNITFQYYFSVFAGLVIAGNVIEEREAIEMKYE